MRAVHVLAICAMATIGSAASAQEIDWKKVDEAIGRSAAVVSGDVHRYGFPRTDLTSWEHALPEHKTIELPRARHFFFEDSAPQMISEIRAFMSSDVQAHQR